MIIILYYDMIDLLLIGDPWGGGRDQCHVWVDYK